MLFRSIEFANECDLNYRVSRNKKLLVELLLIRLCQLTVQASQPKEAPKPATPPAAAAPTVQQPPPQPTPVAAQPAQQPAAPQQPATPSSPAVEKPAPPQQPTPQTQLEQPKSTPISPAEAAIKEAEQRARENLNKYAHNRGPLSFSLRDMTKPKEEAKENTELVAPVEVPAKPFTLQELQEAWIGYAESLTDQVHLRNTMINCKPEIMGEFSFEVALYNQVQQDAFTAVAADIIQHLRQSLQNGKIEMSIRQTAENEVKRAYTTAEKFNLMNEENPSLSKLKDEFDLIPD